MGVVAVVCVLAVLLVAGAAPSSSDDGSKMPEQDGAATWTDGINKDGACGYGDNVAKNDGFHVDMVAGFGLDARHCGKCFRILCTGHPACSLRGVLVTVTDSCRAPECARSATVFDLTPFAFGRMANPGRSGDLIRERRLVAVRYKWDECFYSPSPPDQNIPAFRIDPAATADDFALTVVFVEGLGGSNYITVELKNAGEDEDTWHPMQLETGKPGQSLITNKWKLYPENLSKVVAPMSIRVRESTFIRSRRKSLDTVSVDVIPVGWKPGETYYRHAA